MSQAYEFLKEFKVFFFLTSFENIPYGRPFGAIMEHNHHLYVSTAIFKDVYNQIVNNPRVQIVAKKENSREWIRVSAVASECRDLHMKKLMLETNPNVSKHFSGVYDGAFVLFKLSNVTSYAYNDIGSRKLD